MLDDWQQFVLREALGERADGKWAAPTVGLVVGRQNGKNAILEAIELAGLFLLGEQLIIHSAHEQKTASEQFRRVLNRIRSTPELADRMLKSIAGKGSEGIELKSGARIFFQTRTGGGGRGLTVDRMIYDEAMHLTEDERSALVPTMAAQSIDGNTQSIYTGSAVDQLNAKHDGRPLAQVRLAGIAGADKVAYFEWSAPGESPDKVSDEAAADPAHWAMANPGLGIRISHEWVEHERSVEMGPRGFRVERLSVGDWPDPSESTDTVVDMGAWAGLQDEASEIHGAVCFAYDVKPDRSMAAIAVAGLRADGLWHGEIVDHRRGTGWVAQRLSDLTGRHDSLGVVCAGDDAKALIPDIRALDIRVEEASAPEQAQAFAQFLDGVNERTIRHLGTPELEAALRGAATTRREGGQAWSRKSSGVDICPLVAVTQALSLARKRCSLGEPLVVWG